MSQLNLQEEKEYCFEFTQKDDLFQNIVVYDQENQNNHLFDKTEEQNGYYNYDLDTPDQACIQQLGDFTEYDKQYNSYVQNQSITMPYHINHPTQQHQQTCQNNKQQKDTPQEINENGNQNFEIENYQDVDSQNKSIVEQEQYNIQNCETI